MMKYLLERLELNNKDTAKTAFSKGFAEGILDGLVLLGAVSLIGGWLNRNK